MKLLLIVCLLGSAYSSDNYDLDGIKNEDRRIAGGGNYGGFIGLTTYGAGPFLVKGKYEREKSINDKDSKGDAKNNAEVYDPKLIGNIGYDDIQRDEYNDGRFKNNEKKEDEYTESLGYNNGVRGYCIGENRDYYENKRRNVKNNNSTIDEEINERCDKLFGFTGPTANDEPENLIRPCALDDRQCIRKYLAANSNCKPAYGPIPDPLYIDVNTIFYPTFNMSLALPNLVVRGLSGARISEFYVNRRSGNLVLALTISDLNETIPRAYFRYKRREKEPIVLADYASINFQNVIMTAVIPKVPHLRLDLADIHPDIQDILPTYVIGPGAFNSTDPELVSTFAQFAVLFPVTYREGLLYQSPLFTAIYIQRNICDFGLKIISV